MDNVSELEGRSEYQMEKDSGSYIADTGSNKLVKGRDGYMIVNVNDTYIGRSLIKYGEFSQPELDLFSQIVQRTDTVIEVGSNYGSHTLRLCQLAHQGRVYAIEPQRVVFQALCGNMALNSIFNCHCIQKACSDVDGQLVEVPEANFDVPGNFGSVAIIEDARSRPSDRTVTLDTLFSGIDRLKLLKIDAEGMEARILSGGSKLIERARPILFVENDRLSNSEGLIRLILGYRYRAFWHLSKMFNPSNYNEDSENVFPGIWSVNMICFPRECDLHLRGFHEVLDPCYHPVYDPRYNANLR